MYQHTNQGNSLGHKTVHVTKLYTPR